jgi:type VI secretion system protein ImpH
MERLVEVTRFIVGTAMCFDVQMILRASDVPYCRLDDEGSDAPRLGWIGWLKTGDLTIDAGESVSTWIN